MLYTTPCLRQFGCSSDLAVVLSFLIPLTHIHQGLVTPSGWWQALDGPFQITQQWQGRGISFFMPVVSHVDNEEKWERWEHIWQCHGTASVLSTQTAFTVFIGNFQRVHQCLSLCSQKLSKRMVNNPICCFLFRLFLTWKPWLHKHYQRLCDIKVSWHSQHTVGASSSIKYLLLQNFNLSSMKLFLWTPHGLLSTERSVLQLGLRLKKLLLPPAELWLRLLLGSAGACHFSLFAC